MVAAIREMAVRARQAARELARLTADRKNAALTALAEALIREAPALKAENEKDVEAAVQNGMSAALVDRLRLTDKVLAGMAGGLRDVAALPDPVGEISGLTVRPNGLRVGRMRIPIGVIGFIYESRPNVTVDAAGLCLKSGNAVILRGGSEAIHSNRALAALIAATLTEQGLPEHAVQVVGTPDREAVRTLLTLTDLVDLIIPRGGEGLIRFVAEQATVPVLKHYKGVCHLYVDAGADLESAVRIAENAKVQRPGVCNALEAVLVHREEAARFLPAMAGVLEPLGVELRCCPESLAHLPGRRPAADDDFGREFLDLILAVKVVDDLDAAMTHIAMHGSNHTEAIVTRDHDRAMRFLSEVDASLVLINASTRFNDGGQLGLGAEIGISTSKLHAYGPMGLTELTTTKFVAFGQGQIRGS